MAVVAKRLAQTYLSTTATSRYTAPTGVTAQITEIFLANTGTVDRTVTLYQGGTGIGNTIMSGIVIPGGGCVVLEYKKIVISAGQYLAAKQDVGSDIVLTLYGVEES